MLAADNHAQTRAIMTRALQPNERLIWYDRPSPWRAAADHLFVLIFMAVWTAFAIVWTWAVFLDVRGKASGASFEYIVPLFGTCFALSGMWVLARTAWQIGAGWFTHYGLTNQRLLIMTKLWPGRRLFLERGWLDRIETIGEDDAATLVLFGADTTQRDTVRVPLYNISDAKRVEEALIKYLAEPPLARS